MQGGYKLLSVRFLVLKPVFLSWDLSQQWREAAIVLYLGIKGNVSTKKNEQVMSFGNSHPFSWEYIYTEVCRVTVAHSWVLSLNIYPD